MEYRIVHEAIMGFENLNFAVDLKKLTKAAKNRSYPNLSPCCKTPLVQKKFCSSCEQEIETDTVTHKAFKLGKELYPVSADHLNQIKKNLDSDQIVIKEFRDKEDIPEMYLTDEIYAVMPHKKYAKEYWEYSQILQLGHKVAVGQFIMRERPYPVMIFPFQNNLVIRALHFYEEVDSLPTVTATAINNEKVNLMVQAMQLGLKADQFDLTQFVNVREEQEQKLIEKCLRGEELPEPEKIVVVKKEDNDEIKRLQELLKQRAGMKIEASME